MAIESKDKIRKKAAGKAGSKKDKKPPLGSGERFKELEEKVGSPALAAWIGRKKYGAREFADMAAAGRRSKK